jgi:phosphoglycolate phosphatase
MPREDEIVAAVAAYRERFAETGIYENEAYPDVPAVLAALKHDGQRLWVVTSKAEAFARRIVEHFNLAPFFQRVYGPNLHGKNSKKRDLIASVLQREGLTPSRVYMIVDRAEDIIAGRANGTGTIGCLWGYGPLTSS